MENNYEYVQEAQEKKGSIIGGIVGAVLGAAIGAVAWTLVGMAGYIASIIGFVIAFLADKGYDLLKGRQGVIKMIILIVCVVLAVCVGTLGTYVWSIHNEYSSLSDIEKEYYYPSEPEVIMQVLADSEVQMDMLKDAGLVFGIAGSIGLITAAKNGKQQKANTMKTETADIGAATFDLEPETEHPVEETDATKDVQA